MPDLAIKGRSHLPQMTGRRASMATGAPPNPHRDGTSRQHFLLLQAIVNWQDECGAPTTDAGRDLYTLGDTLLEDDAETDEDTARAWLQSVYGNCLKRGKRRPADFEFREAGALFARLVGLLQKEEGA